MVIPLPARQKYALIAFSVLGLLSIASGLWEYYLSGAVHELAVGGTILFLVVLARIVWTRQAISGPPEP